MGSDMPANRCPIYYFLTASLVTLLLYFLYANHPDYSTGDVISISPLTPPHTKAYNNNNAASSTSTLFKTLQYERNRLITLYGANATFGRASKSVLEHGPNHDILGERLTKSYLFHNPFIVGVTGGSSSAGKTVNNTWCVGFASWLTRLGITVDLRNGAQGATTTLMTAPCIESIVGRNVDLLLWEFAMNDEHTFLQNDTTYPNPIHIRMAETWIRQAIISGASSIGFVHIHDSRLSQYFKSPEMFGDSLPNASYEPFTRAMRAYSSIFGSWFSFDTIGFIAQNLPQLLQVKTDYVRDAHHPTRRTYQVIEDLLSISVIQAWMDYLEKHDMSQLEDDSAATHRQVTRVDDIVPLTPYRKNLIMPVRRTRGHCMGYVYLHQHAMDSPIQFVDPTHIVSKNIGKSDPTRIDRQMVVQIPACTEDPTDILAFQVFLNNVGSILLNCGYAQVAECRKLRVMFDDQIILPNTDVKSDVLGIFFGWIWKRVQDESLPSAGGAQRVVVAEEWKHTITICAKKELAPPLRQQPVNLLSVVVIELY